MKVEITKLTNEERQQLFNVRTSENNRYGYNLLTGISLILIAFGFLVQPIQSIGPGLLAILTAPSNLTTDYFAVGGIGATFINAGLLMFLSIGLVKRLKMDLSGPLIAAILTISGFAFFGKNIYNTIPITLGVYIYSAAMGQPFRNNILAALFGSALGPFVSILTFGINLTLYQGIIIGTLAGLAIGMVLPPLSAAFLRFHAGFNLYNIGFTAGMVGIFSVGILRIFKIDVENKAIIYNEPDGYLFIFFFMLFLGMLALGYYYARKTEVTGEYRELLTNSGRLIADFLNVYGPGATLINMGIMGIIATGYVFVVRGQLSGPVIGGLLTMVGFSAFGNHPRNSIPIMVGVLLATLLTGGGPQTTSALLGALFGTALAPVAGHYGVMVGVITGFCHYAMVANIGYLHGGVNLYNNGFSAGFIAATLVPLVDAFQTATRRENE